MSSPRASRAAALFLVAATIGAAVFFAARAHRPTDAVVAEAPNDGPGSGESPPHATFEPCGRFSLGRTITAVAFDGTRVAVFTADGRLVVAPVPLPESDAVPAPVAAGPTVAALWTDRGLVSAEAGEPPAVAAWPVDGSGDPARYALDERPVDLTEAGAVLRVLTRSPVEGHLVDLTWVDEGSGSPFREVARHAVGRSPVGLFGTDGTHFVPAYGARTVYRVGRDGAEALPVDFRPVAAVPLGGSVVATAANAPTAAVFQDGAATGIIRELPAPWTLVAPVRDGLVAFAASVGTLYRVTGPELSIAVQEHDFDLLTALEPTASGDLLVADAGDRPRLALLDGGTLELLGEVEVEGRPAWVSAVGDLVLVTSPAEGVVAAWRVVRTSD